MRYKGNNIAAIRAALRGNSSWSDKIVDRSGDQSYLQVLLHSPSVLNGYVSLSTSKAMGIMTMLFRNSRIKSVLDSHASTINKTVAN